MPVLLLVAIVIPFGALGVILLTARLADASVVSPRVRIAVAILGLVYEIVVLIVNFHEGRRTWLPLTGAVMWAWVALTARKQHAEADLESQGRA